MKTRRAVLSGAKAQAAATPASPAAAPEDARQRLLNAGLRLFAQQGFAKTSTREVAQAAQVNVAAISYYFGDKLGLYRAVFFGPEGQVQDDIARFAEPGLPLEQALRGFFEAFVAPLREGDLMRLCMKLHLREILEPTGLWEEEVARGIQPVHDAMAQVLAGHLGLRAPDAEVARLTVCLAGLGVHLHVGHDITNQVAPGLNRGAEAPERWGQALVVYGLAMVHAEAARRGVMLQGDGA